MLLNLSSFVAISVQFDESEKTPLAQQIRSTCIYVFHHSFGYRDSMYQIPRFPATKARCIPGVSLCSCLGGGVQAALGVPSANTLHPAGAEGFPVSSFCGWITKSRRDNRTC